MHANLAHRGPKRPHAVGQHVHCAPLHAAVEQTLERLAHFKGIDPVIGRAGSFFGEGTDEGAVLDARNIARIRSRKKTARPLFLVQLDEGAGSDHLYA